MDWIGGNSVRTTHYPYSEEFLQMCDETSNLHKETRAFLAADSKKRPSLLSGSLVACQPAVASLAASNIDILHDAPELIPEVCLWPYYYENVCDVYLPQKRLTNPFFIR